jgi:hypothetical protein
MDESTKPAATKLAIESSDCEQEYSEGGTQEADDKQRFWLVHGFVLWETRG